MKRKEFVALISEDKEGFKNQVISLIEKIITKKVTNLYIEESTTILNNIECKPKEKKIVKESIKHSNVILIPIKEINDTLLLERTHWMVAKDGSQIEISVESAKYLAELYNSLNTLHKEKMLNLISESEHGFKKAVKTAKKLYRR